MAGIKTTKPQKIEGGRKKFDDAWRLACDDDGYPDPDDLFDFISTEIEKAMAEGYREGYEDARIVNEADISVAVASERQRCVEEMEKKVKSKIDCLVADTRNNNTDNDYIGGKLITWEEVLDLIRNQAKQNLEQLK